MQALIYDCSGSGYAFTDVAPGNVTAEDSSPGRRLSYEKKVEGAMKTQCHISVNVYCNSHCNRGNIMFSGLLNTVNLSCNFCIVEKVVCTVRCFPS